MLAGAVGIGGNAGNDQVVGLGQGIGGEPQTSGHATDGHKGKHCRSHYEFQTGFWRCSHHRYPVLDSPFQAWLTSVRTFKFPIGFLLRRKQQEFGY